MAPVLVTISWISYKKHLVRKEVKHQMIDGIDKERLVLLTFTKPGLDELNWEHSREFEYKGEMYDVVYTEVSGDTTKYWCWWDHDETRLNKELSIALNNIFDNNPEKQQKQTKLINFFKSLYFEKSKYSQLVFYPEKTVKTISYYHIIYWSLNQQPLTPPPKLYLSNSVTGTNSVPICTIH